MCTPSTLERSERCPFELADAPYPQLARRQIRRRSASRLDLQQECLGDGTAQAVFGHEFVLCALGWRHLQAMRDCRMQLFYGRVNPYRLSTIDAVADVSMRPASDRTRTCVETQNLESAAAE